MLRVEQSKWQRFRVGGMRAVVKGALLLQNGWLALVRTVLFARHRHTSRAPRRIVVYRTARLGDFINAVPALAALREQFPHARILLLTATSSSALMRRVTGRYAAADERLPWLDLVTPALVDEARVLPLEATRRAWGLVRECLREFQPDTAFLIPYTGEAVLNKLRKMVFLRSAGMRCPLDGWRVQSSFALLRQWQFELGFYRHQTLAALQGVWEHPAFPRREPTAAAVRFPLTIPEAAKDWTGALWRREGWHGKTVIAVLTGASFPHKVWPINRFVAACEKLAEDGAHRFVIIGLGEDREMGDAICAHLPGISLNLAGDSSFVQLAALLGRCQLFLGNDSGPTHLAAAMGCACVTLTASIEPPGIVEPFGSAAGSLRHPVPCAPCFSYTDCPLGTSDCIRMIAVEEVVARSRSLELQADPPKPMSAAVVS